jgi:hypothetical protein
VEQYFVSYPFVGTFGIETVGSRQIDNLRLISGTKITRACFFINGDAREIPNFLVKAGESIKKRAFPTVRIANETDMYLTFINSALWLGKAKLDLVCFTCLRIAVNPTFFDKPYIL